MGPAEEGRGLLGGVVAGCGFYLVLSGVVRQDRVMIRLVRALEGVGANVFFVDEESRVVKANVPASAISVLRDLVDGYLDGVGVEVKASCRLVDAGGVAERLKSAGFRAFRGGRGVTVAYGVYSGRIIEVEVDHGKNRLRVKVGRRTSARPRSPPPPGLFILGVGEAGEALKVLRGLLGV